MGKYKFFSHLQIFVYVYEVLCKVWGQSGCTQAEHGEVFVQGCNYNPLATLSTVSQLMLLRQVLLRSDCES